MKRQIRCSVFETNSSSTHSLSISMKADFLKWVEGKVLRHDGAFLETEKAKQENAKLLRRDGVSEENIQLYLQGSLTLSKFTSLWDIMDAFWYTVDEWNDWLNNRGMETFSEAFVTANGEEVVAWGYYGYDS